MLKLIEPMQIAESIRQKTSVFPSLFLGADKDSTKFEIKPYLQPFEKELAIRELRALLDTDDCIDVKNGYYLVKTDKPEEFFKQRLTYWQRVGRSLLEPTIQSSLEFTQNGLSSTYKRKELHNARRLRYGPHGLHEYRGKFFPQLVRSLINISGIPEDALVLDPMCGSGTTPCEVLVSGRSAIGSDLNPLSVLIATVKSTIVLENPTTFFNIVSVFLNNFRSEDSHPEKIWAYDDLSYLKRWFDSEAIRDLSVVLSNITKVQRPLYRDFFRVCLSNIIRSISWQKDTDLRVRKEIKPYNPGAVIALFKEGTRKQLDKIYPYLCVLSRTHVNPSVTIRQGNSVNVAEMFPEHIGEVDLLITSPPYATALPYLDTDRLSLIVLGLLSRKQQKHTEKIMVGTREVTEKQRREIWERYILRKRELPACISTLIDRIARHNHNDNIGFRRRNLPSLLGKYYLDMLDAMQSAHALMAPRAHGYYVVGNNSTVVDSQKIEIPTNHFLFEIGLVAGWRPEQMIPMELLVSRDIFKKNRGSSESILCFNA